MQPSKSHKIITIMEVWGTSDQVINISVGKCPCDMKYICKCNRKPVLILSEANVFKFSFIVKQIVSQVVYAHVYKGCFCQKHEKVQLHRSCPNLHPIMPSSSAVHIFTSAKFTNNRIWWVKKIILFVAKKYSWVFSHSS